MHFFFEFRYLALKFREVATFVDLKVFNAIYMNGE